MVWPAGEGVCRSPRMLAVMPTLSCPAQCRDCGSGSGPERRNSLDERLLTAAIEEAKQLGFGNVVFTGGEATLRWATLLGGLRLANRLGLRPRLVTNAHWARTPARARELMGIMVASGLDNINFSTGDEHARFVPLERVLFGAVAAVESRLDVHITIEYRSGRSISKTTVLSHPLLTGLTRAQRTMITVSESPWMPIDAMTRGCYAQDDTVDDRNVPFRPGCQSILRTYILEADGRIAACCGLGISGTPELYVGRAEGRGFLRRAVEEAEGDFLKIWIRAKGPENVLAWAARKDPSVMWQGMYAHNCHACRRIYSDHRVRRVIREHHEEVVADVVQTLWFDEYYYSDRLAEVGASDAEENRRESRTRRKR